ncbi:MAG: hypothetical protein ABSH12_05715, partial [Endomicrobiales bacterium]
MNEDISFLRILRFAGRVVLLNASILFFMSAFRLVFCLYYGNAAYLSSHTAYVIQAFFTGMRYDLAVLAYINSIVTGTFLLVWMIRSETLFRKWQKVVRWYYFVVFASVFIILCIDFGFFSYFKNHINILIFGILEDDIRALWSTMFASYDLYLVGAGFVGLIACVFFIVFRIMRFKGPHQLTDAYQIIAHTNTRISGWTKASIMAGLIIANFIAAHGSFILFPPGSTDAEKSPNLFINTLCLNGVVTFQHAVQLRLKENSDSVVNDHTEYKNNLPQAFADFLGKNQSSLDTALPQNLIRYTKVNPALEKNKPNVIIIMMEGFGTDLLHYNSPTFNVMGELKDHFDSDTVFYNFLAGDDSMVGSLETMVTSLPRNPRAKLITQSQFAYKDYP